MDKHEFNRQFDRLASRQKQVLLRMLAGETDTAIAKSLDIAESTVRQHVARICQTFGIKSIPDERRSMRAELVALFAKAKPELLGERPPLPEIQVEMESQYVERPPIESICYKTLLQPGSLLRIKAPSLMGKTSMMAKVLSMVASRGYRTVSLNLHLAETTDFTNLNKFLKWFCVSVGQSLEMPNHLADCWDERYSTSKMNCTAYFEEYLLAASGSPLVLCLDEVERVFPYREVASDFLGLLRAWHEQAKMRDIWKKLRLVVIHSTEVYVPLKINESPFNVGVPIELPEFTPEQVQSLAQRYELSWDLAQVKQVMDIVGGHPYLVQQTLSHLKISQSVTLEQILQNAATEAGICGNHLRRHWCVVQQHEE